jgi:hypothetical protein
MPFRITRDKQVSGGSLDGHGHREGLNPAFADTLRFLVYMGGEPKEM